MTAYSVQPLPRGHANHFVLQLVLMRILDLDCLFRTPNALRHQHAARRQAANQARTRPNIATCCTTHKTHKARLSPRATFQRSSPLMCQTQHGNLAPRSRSADGAGVVLIMDSLSWISQPPGEWKHEITQPVVQQSVMIFIPS